MVKRNDVAIFDALCHASMRDGLHAAECRKVKIPHAPHRRGREFGVTRPNADRRRPRHVSHGSTRGVLQACSRVATGAVDERVQDTDARNS